VPREAPDVAHSAALASARAKLLHGPLTYAPIAQGVSRTPWLLVAMLPVTWANLRFDSCTFSLPVMLAVAIATATSRALSYGTIYTTKLLRRGQDIDRAAPWRAGRVSYTADPQIVYASESLTQTLRALEAYGRDGLPVLSGDGRQIQGWITNASVLRTLAARIGGSPPPNGGGASAGQETRFGRTAHAIARLSRHRG
jgi:hypothetical protein